MDQDGEEEIKQENSPVASKGGKSALMMSQKEMSGADEMEDIMQSILKDEEGLNPMEFSVLQNIQR